MVFSERHVVIRKVPKNAFCGICGSIIRINLARCVECNVLLCQSCRVDDKDFYCVHCHKKHIL